MAYLVRMLERQKWEKLKESKEDIFTTPADTITSELRTKSNTLSLWLIKSLDELSGAVLALAVGRNRITRLDILLLDEDDFEKKGLSIVNSPDSGLSPYTGYNQFHYDLTDMDYEKLGLFSEIIIEKVDDGSKCIRFDKAKIGELLYEGYKKQFFYVEELDKSLQVELSKLIQKKERI